MTIPSDQTNTINTSIMNVTRETEKIYKNKTGSFIYMGKVPTNAGPRALFDAEIAPRLVYVAEYMSKVVVAIESPKPYSPGCLLFECLLFEFGCFCE
jgi:hypothetical protein